MLAQALQYLADEINAKNPTSGGFVNIGNIAQVGQSSGASTAGLQSTVVATIVNIEEEKTLKNGSPYVRTDADKVGKRNPTLYLNLYVLFSCADDDYKEALKRISKVIGFFQAKNLFPAAGAGATFPAGVEQMALDLFSTNFEQINHLWGILGGKYLPSVLYRLRLIAIQESPLDDSSVVREIKADGNTI